MKTLGLFFLMLGQLMTVSWGSSTDELDFVWQGPGIVPLLFQKSSSAEGIYGDVKNSIFTTKDGYEYLQLMVTNDHISITSDQAKGYASNFNSNLYPGDGDSGGTVSRVDYIAGMGFRPNGLHFNLPGTLMIDGNTYSIQISQGHWDTYNNWWLGGPDLTGFLTTGSHVTGPTGDGYPPVNLTGILVTTDGRYMIQVGGNGYTFIIKPLPVAHDWMKQIDDSTMLSSISMPGTHDSGTYAWGYTAELYDYQAQDLSILTQLNLGVRSLDLRLCQNGAGGDIYICHGGNSTFNMNGKILLRDALRQVSDFLSANPSEAVTLIFKTEYLQGGASQASVGLMTNTVIMQELYSQGKLWYKNAVPKLGDVRGKAVVVIRDFLAFGSSGDCVTNTNMGINVQWQDNATFISPPITVGMNPCPAASVPFSIQDKYKDHNSNDKYSDVLGMLFNINLNGAWFINYLSATNNDSVWGVAQNINPAVVSLFNIYDTSSAVAGYGTTPMDFVGTSSSTVSTSTAPSIVTSIISKNKFNQIESKSMLQASHKETKGTGGSGKKTMDSYKLKIRMKFRDGDIEPLEMMSYLSGIRMELEAYKFHKLIAHGKTTSLKKGKPGKTIYYDNNQNVMVKWGKKYIDIVLYTPKPRTDGVNIVAAEQTIGQISGALDTTYGVNWRISKKSIPWVGRSNITNNGNGGVGLHSWYIKSSK